MKSVDIIIPKVEIYAIFIPFSLILNTIHFNPSTLWYLECPRADLDRLVRAALFIREARLVVNWREKILELQLWKGHV